MYPICQPMFVALSSLPLFMVARPVTASPPTSGIPYGPRPSALVTFFQSQSCLPFPCMWIVLSIPRSIASPFRLPLSLPAPLPMQRPIHYIVDKRSSMIAPFFIFFNKKQKIMSKRDHCAISIRKWRNLIIYEQIKLVWLSEIRSPFTVCDSVISSIVFGSLKRVIPLTLCQSSVRHTSWSCDAWRIH